MALPNPAAGDSVAAAHIDSIRTHLEGGSGDTAPYKLRQSTGDFIVVLADNAGASELSIHDSDDAEVAHIDSNGNLTATTVTFTNLDIPVSASPSQTADGRAVWDSDDDVLTIGDGSSRKTFYPGLTQYISKAADESVTSSTTLQNDDHFTLTATANTVYIIELFLYLEAGGGSGNFKFAWTLPSGTHDTMQLVEGAANTVLVRFSENIASGTEFGGFTYASGVATKITSLVTLTTGGTVTLQWAQGSSNGTASTIGANSWMTYRKVIA